MPQGCLKFDFLTWYVVTCFSLFLWIDFAFSLPVLFQENFDLTLFSIQEWRKSIHATDYSDLGLVLLKDSGMSDKMIDLFIFE